GTDLSAFFDRSIRSTEELDYSPFQHVGMELKFRVKESPTDRGGSAPRLKPGELKARGWLGATFKSGSTIACVLEGSRARTGALSADDGVVARDGFRVDGGPLISRCEEKVPGEVVSITVFRQDRLVELKVKLENKPADAAYLQRVEHPTDSQK